MNKKRTSYSFEFVDTLRFLIKWKKQLSIIVIVAVAASVVGSGTWFITPKYKATAVFYPGTVSSISSALFFKSRERAKEALAFGEQEETEQYLQILESADLQWRIINKYNLINHYKISQDRKDKYDQVSRTYAKNVSIKRTDYNSISITVMDEDPKTSAELANAIMGMVDTIKHEIVGRVAKQAHDVVAKAYFEKLNYIDSLKNAMKLLGEKGVYNAPEQAKGLAEVAVVSRGGSEKEKQALAEYSGEFTVLDELLQNESEMLADLRMRYEQTKIDMAGGLSNVFVVGYAYPPENKAYPVRSIIVVMSALSAFVFGCILIVFIERYKEIKERF